jgi:predicted esterase
MASLAQVPPGITRITNHTASVVGVGALVRMQVFVMGTTPSLQWYQNGLPLAGKTSSLLNLSNVQTTNTGLYTVVVTNFVGSLTSSPLSLEVTSRPQIQYTDTLQSKAVFVGTGSSFAVTAFGVQPLSYQWRLDAHDLLGQTNKTLTFSSAQPGDEGDYTVVVTNLSGTVTSAPARLWVVPTFAAGRWANFTNASGQRLPYWCLVPTNYVPTRRYPLICTFHGGGPDETSFPSVFAPVPVFASYKQQATDPAIVVFPTRRAGHSVWTDQYLPQVFDLLDWLITQFNIDTNRIYVGGVSDGVHAAWDSLGMRPDFFAAAFLSVGSPGSKPASVIRQVPAWVACAADDAIAGVTSSRNLVGALRRAGGNPIYTEYNSGGHLGGALMSLSTPAMVDWTLAQRRSLPPATDPLLAITSPTQGAVFATSATNLNLAGAATVFGEAVIRVVWTNTANQATGDASGSNTWAATSIPLQGNQTNLISVIATTTATWAPAFGGNTTFNDTLTVIQSPVRATLTLQGTDALLNWTGGGPPYRVQQATDLAAGDWTDFPPNATPPLTLPLTGQAGFYRVVGQ